MEEQVNMPQSGQPQQKAADLPPAGGATIPAEDPNGQATAPYLEIKFNKELIQLDRESAVTLAQKGMKFDLISAEYERLKSLSRQQGQDVGTYLSGLEAVGTKKEEDAAEPEEMGRLRKEFPEISSADMLPEEVRTAAKNNNTGLLHEYLLYEHRLKRAADAEADNQLFASSASTGSLAADDRQDPANAEFLRGVWGR